MKRDWRAAHEKMAAEGYRCRNCGKPGADCAHIAGREFDQPKTTARRTLWVDPDSVLPLCGPPTDPTTCHGKQTANRLDLLGILTPEEEARAVLDLKGLENARVRLAPSLYANKIPTMPVFSEDVREESAIP